jgi:hypothetical protein
MKQQIIGYFRYVGNILILYYQKKTNMAETISKFKKQRTNIKLNIEKEQRNFINFLDLTIHRKRTKLELGMYIKPTQIDVIMPNHSCHSYEHKTLSNDYLIEGMHCNISNCSIDTF